MTRGTTPTHIFKFSVAPATMDNILVTYVQRGKIIIEKHKSDLTFESRVISGTTYYFGSYTLTQNETKKFNSDDDVEIQVRALMTDDTALASNIYTINVRDVLNDEVLV